MPFFKTASSPILGVYQSSGRFVKCAAQLAKFAQEEDARVRQAINLFAKGHLGAISKIYSLSENPDDYIFLVARALTADVPNNNGDNFQHEELTRFSPDHRCLVYETFRNDPLFIEHAADDPKTARGYLPDAHYVTGNTKDRHVLTVVAVDTTKDEPYSKSLLNGEADAFSMGCICEAVECSYPPCKKIAYSDKELCDHQRHYKMTRIAGHLIYQNCLGVEYKELSGVGSPADPTAVAQLFLRYAAMKSKKAATESEFNLISRILSETDAFEVSRFFHANANKLPDAMLRLADKLF
jgi:hypothetical protein